MFSLTVGAGFRVAASVERQTEFVRSQTKRSRMEEFDRSKDTGVAPTPLLSARMFTFGDAVRVVPDYKPDPGKPLHVTRV